MKDPYKIGYALGYYGTYLMATVAALVVLPILGIALMLAGLAWFIWYAWQAAHQKQEQPLECHKKRDWNNYEG